MELKFGKDKPEMNSARDIFEARLSSLRTMEFFIDRFLDYSHDANYKESFKEHHEKFKEFLKSKENPGITLPKEQVLKDIIDYGVLFLMTNPMFSVHEFVEAGAIPTEKEAAQFLLEMAGAILKGSQREKILPYAAVVGYTIIEHFSKETDFEKAVADKIATMHDLVSGALVKTFIKTEMSPQEKAMILCEQLEGMGIIIDKEGKVEDPQKVLEDDTKMQEKIWKLRNREPGT